jgi:hypothetical protein
MRMAGLLGGPAIVVSVGPELVERSKLVAHRAAVLDDAGQRLGGLPAVTFAVVAVAIMEQQHRPWTDTAAHAIANDAGAGAGRIPDTECPSEYLVVVPRQDAPQVWIAIPVWGTETRGDGPGRGLDCLVGGTHLPRGTGWTGERQTPVRLGMVADLEARTRHQPAQLGVPFDVPSHHKESGRHLLAPEKSNDRFRRIGIGPVVERKIEGSLARTSTDDRSEHGTVGSERAVGQNGGAGGSGTEERRQHDLVTRW